MWYQYLHWATSEQSIIRKILELERVKWKNAPDKRAVLGSLSAYRLKYVVRQENVSSRTKEMKQ